jgi:hypothetical protein
MLAQLNSILRRRLPGLHGAVKRRLQAWMESADPACSIPRLLTRSVAVNEPVILEWMKAHVTFARYFERQILLPAVC